MFESSGVSSRNVKRWYLPETGIKPVRDQSDRHLPFGDIKEKPSPIPTRTMPKQRLTGLDIHALSTELQCLLTYRLQNIYGIILLYLTLIADINSRTFLLKFAVPDSKKNVIIESGMRIHLTNYSREKSSSPSHFVAKVCISRQYLISSYGNFWKHVDWLHYFKLERIGFSYYLSIVKQMKTNPIILSLNSFQLESIGL